VDLEISTMGGSCLDFFRIACDRIRLGVYGHAQTCP